MMPGFLAVALLLLLVYCCKDAGDDAWIAVVQCCGFAALLMLVMWLC